MKMFNYHRVLNNAKCSSCNFEGYNINFENYITETEKETKYGVSYKNEIKIICPNCKSHNTMIEDTKIENPTIKNYK